MALTTKKRSFPDPPGNYDFESWLWNGILKRWESPNLLSKKTLPWPTLLKGKQITASENHPHWRKRSRNRFGGDIGGPFRTEKFLVEGKPSQVHLSGVKYQSGNLNSKARYDGICWAVNPADLLLEIPVAPESADSLLEALGTQAMARVKPTNSIADLATTLGELYREGLPRAIGAAVWRDKADAARKTSGDFLGVEFGYKPIVSEIYNFADAVINADAVLAQYERDAGKIVRRSLKFPTETGGNTIAFKAGQRPFIAVSHSAYESTSGSPSGLVSRTEIWSRERWFEGAFTYYLPSDYKSRKEMGRLASKARVLLGTDLSPEVLWNLTPWSWAIDWVSNTGDVLGLLSDWLNDGLVLRYGYIMEHSFRKYIYTYSGPQWYTGGNVVPAPLIISHEVKKRVKATPFGFGLTWEGFTPRQVAILTALGISRSK